MATYLLASGDAAQPGNLRYHRDGPRITGAWAHWDAHWYLLIADLGYRALEDAPELAPRNVPSDTSGFFPLYPGAIAALVTLTGGLVSPLSAGLLLSNAALLGFLYLLHAWTADRLGERAAALACLAAAAAPTTLFLSAPYSESLFLMLAVGTLLAAERRRPALAAFLGAAAALTRPVGVLLALPLLLPPARLQGGWRSRAAAAGPAAGLLAYMGFCQAVFDDPLAFVARQERWRGPMGPPWTFLTEFLQDPNAHGRTGSAVDLTVALICLALLPVVFRRLGPGPGLFATAALALPLCSGLFSFSRLALAAFPLFAALGSLGAHSPRRVTAYLCVSLPFAGLFTALYATGWWVG